MNGWLASWFVLFLVFSTSCDDRDAGTRARAVDEAKDAELRSTPPPPGESRTLKQGFTQRPSPETPGLPPPLPPLLDERERGAIAAKRATIAPDERARAQKELESLVATFEKDAAAAPPPSLERLRSAAIRDARGAAIDYLNAEELYRKYLFPNDVGAADAELAGTFVLLEGVVAPHNMLDLADGFKLFEETPYVQEPVLLATEYELSFVRCHLARAEIQKLRDWEEVHVLGLVEGKKRGDVVLRRCVVL